MLIYLIYNLYLNSFKLNFREMTTHLSWVEWLAGVALHEEHVDELDEDAGSRL